MRFAVLALLAAGVTLADVAVLQPDAAAGKDALVHMDYPDENFGDLIDLITGVTATQAAVRSFIEFTELNDPQYQGATVTSAYLALYCRDHYGSGLFFIASADAYWEEDVITWNNAPSWVSGSQLPADFPSAAGWINFDVTGIVQSWLDGSVPNNGFILFADGVLEQWMTVCSSDWSSVEEAPKLIVAYEPLGLSQTTWAGVKGSYPR